MVARLPAVFSGKVISVWSRWRYSAGNQALSRAAWLGEQRHGLQLVLVGETGQHLGAVEGLEAGDTVEDGPALAGSELFLDLTSDFAGRHGGSPPLHLAHYSCGPIPGPARQSCKEESDAHPRPGR